MPYRSLEIHRHMLSDASRVEAYAAALRARLCAPGARVLDVGSGTGIWAVASARAGAKEIVAIEPTDMIVVAREFARANGVAEKIRWIQKNLHEALDEIRPLAPFDAVVSEMMGDLLVDEHLIPICRAAHELLSPSGAAIPASYEVLLAPLALEEADAAPRFWSGGVALSGLGRLDTSPAAALAENAPVLLPFPAGALLAEGAVAARLDARALPEKNALEASATFELARAGALTGIGLWWRSEMAPGITLDTGPHAPPTHWARGIFPLPRTVLAGGSRVSLRVKADCAARPQVWSWAADGAVRASRTTFRALALGPEARARLAGTAPTDRPAAGAEALRFARLALLLDGTRTLAEAAALAARAPDGRPDPAWGDDPVAEARRLLDAAGRLRGLKR